MRTMDAAIDGRRAVRAGLLAGLIMLVAASIVGLAGVRFEIPMLLGTMFGIRPSVLAWFAGFGVHLFVSVVSALGYGYVFERIGRATPAFGASLAVVHVVIGGVFYGLLDEINPLMPEVVPAPGPFFSGYGVAAVLTFVALHVLYGAIVGEVYELRRKTVTAVAPTGLGGERA